MSTRKPLTIEISPGELLDRISILQLKARNIDAAGKRAIAREQLEALLRAREALGDMGPLDPLRRELDRVNEAIWESEDRLRACERANDFGRMFVEHARRVYLNNDRRATLKRRIDEGLGVCPGEVKSYAARGPSAANARMDRTDGGLGEHPSRCRLSRE